VFPSFSDGFELVLLEAMACGLPAIASEASIGPEIITANCGFVTPPGDLDSIDCVGRVMICLRQKRFSLNYLDRMSRSRGQAAARLP
jgi:alpha-maltose-1-phosphate synthase